jgi:hypothetical protein
VTDSVEVSLRAEEGTERERRHGSLCLMAQTLRQRLAERLRVEVTVRFLSVGGADLIDTQDSYLDRAE